MLPAADGRAAKRPGSGGRESGHSGRTVGAGLVLAIARETDLPASAIDRLSPAERAHAGSRLRPGRRRQFVGGRFLLRVLLEHLTGQACESHGIRVDENGKPRCTSGLAVSVAHSRGLIVCAAATDGEVGADVECSDFRRDRRQLARHYFSAAESAWLEERPPEDFYRLWVLKEAWLKMQGTGIAGGLSRLQCRVEPPVIEAAVIDAGDCRLSLLACHGALIGLATDRVDHGNLISLCWRTQSQGLGPATEAACLASGIGIGIGAGVGAGRLDAGGIDSAA